jgi:sulfite reductase beta subunit-like hemoprotein
LDQGDGRFSVTAIAPLGRVDPGLLPGAVRFSSAKTVTLVDVEDVDAATASLRAAGLVTTADEGWAGLSACSGLGLCARARGDVREAARRRVTRRRANAPVEHWSGCERGCGRPQDAGVSVTMTADGVVVGGDLVPDLEAALERLG